MHETPTVVLFSTVWGVEFGGLNAFNYDLCIGFKEAGCQVSCIVPAAKGQAVADARARGISLHDLGGPTPEFTQDLIPVAAGIIREVGQEPDLWIGHDIHSGEFAIEARERVGSAAPVAVVHHMHFLSYKSIESTPAEADRKHEQQKQVFSRANLVFAVGPKLYRTALDLVASLGEHAPKVFELVPGLPHIDPVAAPNQFKLFLAGRLAGKAALLKQPALAAAAFGEAIRRSPTHLGPDPILTAIGTDADRNLEDLATEHASRHATVISLAYINSRNEMLGRLREQSAAMLLSVHEGFGLTAWEAIGAGVPLILSRNSGVYELLKQRHGGPATGCVQAVDILAPNRGTPDPRDVQNIADKIIELAGDVTAARRDALKLRESLTAYTWVGAARVILDAAGVSSSNIEAPSAAPTDAPASPAANLEDRERVDLRSVLFDVYSPNCDSYVVVRDLTAQVRTQLEHMWLWGPTGSGKTTLIRHVLLKRPGYCYVSLSSCVGQPISTIFESLYLELSEIRGYPPTQLRGLSLSDSIRKIVSLMTERTAPSLIVHIDEIPCDDAAAERDFCRAVAGLIGHQKSKAPLHGTRYVLSTITEPSSHFAREQKHIRERLAVFEVPLWSAKDLGQIVDLAGRYLDVKLSDANISSILQQANGSPRFVKSCLRKLIIFRGSDLWTFERVLTETAMEIFS